MRESKLLALWQAVITALAVLAGSVAVPILCRPFYYAHIGALHLEEWGLTREEIRQAYDQMLDFCLGLRPDFSAGVLRFSDEGWGPEFRPLAEEIARRGWSPTLICESSGTQSEDALTMKAIYQEVSRS